MHLQTIKKPHKLVWVSWRTIFKFNICLVHVTFKLFKTTFRVYLHILLEKNITFCVHSIKGHSELSVVEMDK